MIEPARKCQDNGIFKQNYSLKLLITFKMAYSWCFSLGGYLDFPDFLQKKFYIIDCNRPDRWPDPHHSSQRWLGRTRSSVDSRERGESALEVRPSSSGMKVEWITSSGQSYELLFNRKLRPTDWKVVESATPEWPNFLDQSDMWPGTNTIKLILP